MFPTYILTLLTNIAITTQYILICTVFTVIWLVLPFVSWLQTITKETPNLCSKPYTNVSMRQSSVNWLPLWHARLSHISLFVDYSVIAKGVYLTREAYILPYVSPFWITEVAVITTWLSLDFMLHRGKTWFNTSLSHDHGELRWIFKKFGMRKHELDWIGFV